MYMSNSEIEQKSMCAVAKSACGIAPYICGGPAECRKRGCSKLVRPFGMIMEYDCAYDNERVTHESLAYLASLRSKHQIPLTEEDMERQANICRLQGEPCALVRTEFGNKYVWLKTLRTIMNMMECHERTARWAWIAELIERHEPFIRNSGDDRAIAEVGRRKVYLMSMPEYPAIKKWLAAYIVRRNKALERHLGSENHT